MERLAARLPGELRVFAELAYDYAWSWSPGGSALFQALDPHGWEASGHNPVRLLLEAPTSRLERAAQDGALRARAEALREALARAAARPFREAGPVGLERPVAFFCAEFAVHRSLPVYAGGLGVLAGDLLKQASDQGLPLLGIGLFYRQGYLHQRLDPGGWQHEYWVHSDPQLLPMALVSGPDGNPLGVRVPLRGRDVALRIWRVALGRTSLYLLDADCGDNRRVDRWITARLYDASREVRLAQYAVLGLGGVRVLRALGVEPGVVHLNEGHAAFAAIELAREGVASGLAPRTALEAVRERIVFTTHTPVPAGNETYAAEEVAQVLPDAAQQLGVAAKELVSFGRSHPDDAREPLGMTVLALRASRRANAVSRRHGEVAREMWQTLWPGRPVERVPIGHVTNGVHLPTWMAEPMRALLDRHLGPGWAERAADPATWEAVEAIPDAELWQVRNVQRARLVELARDRSVADRLARGEPSSYVEAAAHAFDPNVLTVGFARRVAAYKRLHLLAREPERALAILRGERPVQVVLAGKAHPKDEEAKHLVGRVFALKRELGVGERVVFLEDYGVGLAAPLVAGCDVWVNLPRAPLEASGTSGMKAVLNGSLHLSVLDGWWAEAHAGANGWALPADPNGNEEARDARDARILYDLIEHEVVPLFYERDADDIPRGWIARVKASLRSLAPRFGAGRMLDDYLHKVYAPQ